MQATPESGTALIFTNVTRNRHNQLVADTRTVHAAEPPVGEGVVKYGVNIWFRGAQWGGIVPYAVVVAKCCVPRRMRWIWPAGLGSDLCLFCGAPLVSEESRWEVSSHASDCCFRERLSQVALSTLEQSGEDLIIKVEKCNVQFVYSKRFIDSTQSK